MSQDQEMDKGSSTMKETKARMNRNEEAPRDNSAAKDTTDDFRSVDVGLVVLNSICLSIITPS